MCKEKQSQKTTICGCPAMIRTVERIGDGLWKCPRCGGFIVGMTESVQKKMDIFDEAMEVLRECDEYLDENNLNNIGNRSTLHSKMKVVLAKRRENE